MSAFTTSELMAILVNEGDIDRGLADDIIAIKEGRARVIPVAVGAVSANPRPYVTDQEWSALTDEMKERLNRAFDTNDSDTLIDFVGEPLSKATVKVLQAEADKLATKRASEAETKLSCVGGFSYNPKRKAYYSQVRIDGPAPKGFSEPRHRAISVHQVAITAALCQQIGPDAVMAACRDALECVKVAKENKITVGGFGTESTDD